MRSVADDLRREDAHRLKELTVDERVALAHSLGEEDLKTMCGALGVSREQALAKVRRARQAGRVRSRCMDVS